MLRDPESVYSSTLTLHLSAHVFEHMEKVRVLGMHTIYEHEHNFVDNRLAWAVNIMRHNNTESCRCGTTIVSVQFALQLQTMSEWLVSGAESTRN